MNIKIKSSGVYCLVGEDYDRVYHALQSQLGDGELQLFTERIPGHEYLQWELPGDGWIALATGDPLIGLEVRKELLRRQKAVSERFGTNQDIAQRVLSVPDDQYIFYKMEANGQLAIRLAVWGYRYPERIIGPGATGELPAKAQKEHVSIHLVYDEKPVPEKPVKLNGFPRATDASGAVEIGELPVGYQFDIDVESLHQHVVVEAGEGYITLDLTKFTTLEVIVTRDVLPYASAKISVSYKGRQVELVTDANGYVRAKFPLDPDHGFCSVTVEGETQQRPLDPQSTTFRFDLVTTPPAPIVDSSEDIPEEGSQEPLSQQEEPDPEPKAPPVMPEEPVVQETGEEPEPQNQQEEAPVPIPWWWWLIFAILTALTFWVSLHFFI